jgi:divalent metal cation (Fe/Co/Zn/Cd) transporter
MGTRQKLKADPIFALLIAATVLVIVGQSARSVFTLPLDDVEPNVVAEMHHAREHLPRVREVLDARAPWLGHHVQVAAGIAIGAWL